MTAPSQPTGYKRPQSTWERIFGGGKKHKGSVDQPTQDARPAVTPTAELPRANRRADSPQMVRETTEEEGVFQRWRKGPSAKPGQRKQGTNEKEHVAGLTKSLLVTSSSGSTGHGIESPAMEELMQRRHEVAQLTIALRMAQEQIQAQQERNTIQKALIASLAEERAAQNPNAQPEGNPGGIKVHNVAGSSNPTRKPAPADTEVEHLEKFGYVDDEELAVTGNGLTKLNDPYASIRDALARAAKGRADQTTGITNPVAANPEPRKPATPSTMTSGDEFAESEKKRKRPKKSKSRKGKARHESSTDESSSSSESSSEEDRKKKRKSKDKDEKRAAMKALSIGKPSTYKGEADYDRRVRNHHSNERASEREGA